MKAPASPTAIERDLHNMTHLPFRSWCLVCLKAKSKSDQHKHLKLKQPLIQVDFAFWTDSTGFSLPILTAIDVISAMASASALPSKEFSNYAVTELKRFVYEVGRTYEIIQCGQENVSIAIVKAVINEIGGTTYRLASKGSGQRQGSVGRHHETLDGQGRALRMRIELAYTVTISSKDAIVPWIVSHASWLLNRYLLHDDGLTGYQRRWQQYVQQYICEFGETVIYLDPDMHKSKENIWISWNEGLWLGRCSDPAEH